MRHHDPLWSDLVTERVLSVIDAHGDSQSEAARKLGVYPSVVRNWRHSGKCPDLYSVASVARLYKADANWLLGLK